MKTNKIGGALLLFALWGSQALTGSTQGLQSPQSDANASISPIIRTVDQNLLGMNGETHRRTKQYI
jgi:hypothetical protein